MHIELIKIGGLKGPPVEYKLARLNLIDGPNGSGKSRILDAVRFAFGGRTAGVAADGRNLSEAMKGKGLFVELVVLLDSGERITIRRERQTTARGVFSRSVLSVDGAQVDRVEQLGPFNLERGRTLVDMSPEALLSAVSTIGAATGSGALIASLEAAVESVSGKPAPKGPPLYRLEAALDWIADCHRETKRDVADASASQDRSRRDLGTARVVPGFADEKAAEALEASDALETSGASIGEARSRVASANATIGKLETKLERAGSGGEDLEAAEAALAEEREKCDGIFQAKEKAQAEKEYRAQNFSAIEQKIAGIENRCAAFQSDLARAKDSSSQLEAAPCARREDWVSLDDQDLDPFVEPENLCGKCPFTSRAREAGDKIEQLETEIEQLATSLEELTPTWQSDGEYLNVAKAALDQLSDDLRSSTSRVRIKESAASEARRSAGASAEDRQAWKDEIREAQAESKAARALLEKEQREGEALRARRSSALAEEREARVQEGQLLRLKADEKRAGEAEEKLATISELSNQAKLVKRSLAEAGEKRLLEEGSALVVAPWELAFSEGRVGLRGPSGDFWTGAGLSAAQKEILFAALDFAQSAIDGESFVLSMIEADTIDDEARPLLLDQLEGALERGELSQAFVCSWARIDDLASDAWTRIEVESRRDEKPEEPEEDPFAAPAYVDTIQAGEGPSLTRWLQAIKKVRPGAYQKIPRKLGERRTLLLELLEEMPDDEKEAILCTE